MTLSVTAAELVVTKPNSSSHFDFVVPADDILSLSLSGEAGRRVASGKAVLDSPDGRYTTGDTCIDADDRIRAFVTTGTATTESAFGAQAFTEGPFGGGPAEQLGSTIVTETAVDGPEHAATLTLTVESFVGNRLNEREVHYGKVGRPIATGDDSDPGHLDAILKQFAPEVGRDRITPVDAEIDFAARKQPVIKAVNTLAKHARAETGTPVITTPRDQSLLFAPLDTLDQTVDETLTVAPYGDLGDVSSSSTPPTANEIRVEGGVDDENLLDDSQTTQTSTTTLTDSTRKQVRVRARKREIPRVEVYTQAVSGSTDKIRVRVQADDGGSPVAPADADSDIASGTAEDQPSDTGGYQDVRFGEYTLAPQGNPWLIFESTGSGGVDVGVDGTGTPTFKAHFFKPVITVEPSTSSQARFRLHERTVEDESVVTFDAARQLARATLERTSVQRVTVDATALSARAHALRVGDLVDLDEPWARAEGTHIVTGYEATYQGSDLNTTLTLESEDTYA